MEETLTNKQCSSSGGGYFDLIPFDLIIKSSSTGVHGLVCQRRMEDENHVVAVISNPITGEYVTSPKLLTYGNIARRTKTYFGYDPINKKFKVLCLTWSLPGNLQHQVLTLETNGKGLLWRQIPCCISYSPPDDGICINGILYYYTYTEPFYKTMIICFDVMSEKFDFVTDGTDDQFELNMIMLVPPTLINYKGKLAACAFDDYNGFLWVLEEHKWSKHIYKMPLQWRGLGYSYDIGGVTSSGEVVFCPNYAAQVPFYIFYYNLETNIVVEVRVEVPEFDGHSSIKAFSQYVEDVKLM